MLFFILGVITYIRRQWAKFYNYCLKNSLILYWTHIAIYNISQSLVSHKILPPYNHLSIYYFKRGSPKLAELVYKNETATTEHIAGLLRIPCPGAVSLNALIMHHGGGTIQCFVNPPTTMSQTKIPRQFLSVLYSHPQMKDTIPMELDTAIYLSGNEILSAAFVERYLMYQARPYVFDANYKLELMNKKIQMFELDSTQYVVLNTTGYTVGSACQN
jgi:hypothetical protein